MNGHQAKVVSESIILVGCGKSCPLPNQIAGFFDHHYLWKESVDVLSLFDRNHHQGKTASEATTFGWMFPFVHLVQSNCKVLLSTVSVEGINIL